MADVANRSVSESVNGLGISLLQALSKGSGERNVFISPFSLSTALAMLHCGARGETREEMRRVLGFEDAGLPDEKVAEAFSGLLSSLDESSNSYVLSCANSLVAQSDFSVKEEYKELLKGSFRASLFEADFKTESEKAVKDINNWVGEKTNGMIPKLLDSLDSTTVMVLLNAIYFKGTWQNTFDESSTKLQDFYNGGSKNNAKKVKMMHQKGHFGYSERETFTVLHMPYTGNSAAMMVLLPKSIDGIGELETQLSPVLFKELRAEMRLTKVNVSLPQFRFEYEKTMKETLQALGVNKVFESNADLMGMSNKEFLYVSDVVHKAVIEVNETGSEASAATAIVIECYSMMIGQIPNFAVYHPFLFAIYSLTNDALLFLGKIEEL